MTSQKEAPGDSPDTQMKSGDTVPILLRCRYTLEHPYTTRLAVTGSIEALGGWNPAAAVRARYNDAWETWEVRVIVPCNTAIEWKWISLHFQTGTVFLQEKQNRQLSIKDEGFVVDTKWNWVEMNCRPYPGERKESNLKQVTVTSVESSPDETDSEVSSILETGDYGRSPVSDAVPVRFMAELERALNLRKARSERGQREAPKSPRNSIASSSTCSNVDVDVDVFSSCTDILQVSMTPQAGHSWHTCSDSKSGILRQLVTGKVPVLLRVRCCPSHQSADGVAVLGSIETLGCWKPSAAVRAGTNDGLNWEVRVVVPRSISFEWKWVVVEKDAVLIWEEIGSRELVIEDIGLDVSTTWNCREMVCQALPEDYLPDGPGTVTGSPSEESADEFCSCVDSEEALAEVDGDPDKHTEGEAVEEESQIVQEEESLLMKEESELSTNTVIETTVSNHLQDEEVCPSDTSVVEQKLDVSVSGGFDVRNSLSEAQEEDSFLKEDDIKHGSVTAIDLTEIARVTNEACAEEQDTQTPEQSSSSEDMHDDITGGLEADSSSSWEEVLYCSCKASPHLLSDGCGSDDSQPLNDSLTSWGDTPYASSRESPQPLISEVLSNAVVDPKRNGAKQRQGEPASSEDCEQDEPLQNRLCDCSVHDYVSQSLECPLCICFGQDMNKMREMKESVGTTANNVKKSQLQGDLEKLPPYVVYLENCRPAKYKTGKSGKQLKPTRSPAALAGGDNLGDDSPDNSSGKETNKLVVYVCVPLGVALGVAGAYYVYKKYF